MQRRSQSANEQLGWPQASSNGWTLGEHAEGVHMGLRGGHAAGGGGKGATGVTAVLL